MGNGEATAITLAKLTRISIIVYIVSTIAYLAFTVLTFVFAEQLASSAMANDGDLGATNDFVIFIAVTGLISILNFISIPATIILVATWVYRTWANLHEAQLGGLNYTPRWATASFFIPFVNMVVPKRALRELHNRSHGESDWHAAASVGDVTSWYGCTWAAFLVGTVLSIFLGLEFIPGLYVLMPTAGWIGLVALFALFLFGSAWFLYRIVGSVTSAQSQMLHYSQAEIFE